MICFSNMFSILGKRSRPSFCPKSPGSMHRLFGSDLEVPVMKTIKPPASSDKKTLYALSTLVNDVLQHYEYSKRMAIEDFCKMTVMDYYNICKVRFSMFARRISNRKQLIVILENLYFGNSNCWARENNYMVDMVLFLFMCSSFWSWWICIILRVVKWTSWFLNWLKPLLLWDILDN